MAPAPTPHQVTHHITRHGSSANRGFYGGIKLQKWGNSLGLRLPKKLAEDLEIETGSEVDIAIVKGKLVLTPIKPRKQTLSELLSKVTPSNRHDEVELGNKRGRETW